MTANKTQQQIDSLGASFDDAMDCLLKLIEDYGEVRLLTKSPLNPLDHLRDFLLFCITKSTKSLLASVNMIEAGFFQDALIILRTVYENYLTIAYLYENPERLPDVFHSKTGRSSGFYTPFINDRGKVKTNKLVDTESGRVIQFNHLSVYSLAKGSIFKTDIEVHPLLYKFLSEFIHPDMICSGSYRDQTTKNYSLSVSANMVSPMWNSTYLITLLLQLIVMRFKLSDADKKEFQRTCESNITKLIDFCEFSLVDTPEDDVTETLQLVKKRLEETAPNNV